MIFDIIIGVIVITYIMYMISIAIQLALPNNRFLTRRKFTFVRLLIPFWYWIADPNKMD